ncbi:hypothetical protein ACLEB1_06510, partial [Escherichia coli]
MGQSKKLNKQPSSLSPLVQLAGIRKCFDGKEVIPQCVCVCVCVC